MKERNEKGHFAEGNSIATGRPKKRDCIRDMLRVLLELSPEDFNKYAPNTLAQEIAKKKILMARDTDDWKEIDGLINQTDGNPNTPIEHAGDGFTLNIGWKKGDD